MNAELRKQEACHQRAGDADQDIADDTKAGATHDLAGQPAGDKTNKQNNEKAFIGYMHWNPPGVARVTLALRCNLLITARCDDPNLRVIQSAEETFQRCQRCDFMTQPDTWYVAFGPDKAVKTDDGAATGAVRSTRTFKSVVDAKLFAMQILAKRWTATAGTLNPHQPKTVVGASQVERWADPGLGG
jgi:hypothetical protein